MTRSVTECREVRALADAYLDDELLVETNHAVLAHLRTCPACRAEMQARAIERAALKRAFADDPSRAPTAAFTASLTNHLRAAAATRTSPIRYVAWIAAAAVLAVALVWSIQRERSTQLADEPAMAALVESAVGDHIDCALRQQPSAPPIPLDRASYDGALRGLDGAVRSSASRLASPAQELGAHACIWRGRRFGHVVLSYKSEVVSVLVTQPEGSVARHAASNPSQCATTAEFAVACFAAPEHAVFVVSALPAGEAVSLAQELAPAMREHLSRRLATAQPTAGESRAPEARDHVRVTSQ